MADSEAINEVQPDEFEAVLSEVIGGEAEDQAATQEEQATAGEPEAPAEPEPTFAIVDRLTSQLAEQNRQMQEFMASQTATMQQFQASLMRSIQPPEPPPPDPDQDIAGFLRWQQGKIARLEQALGQVNQQSAQQMTAFQQQQLAAQQQAQYQATHQYFANTIANAVDGAIKGTPWADNEAMKVAVVANMQNDPSLKRTRDPAAFSASAKRAFTNLIKAQQATQQTRPIRSSAAPLSDGYSFGGRQMTSDQLDGAMADPQKADRILSAAIRAVSRGG